MIGSESRTANMNALKVRLATATCLVMAGVFFVLFPVVRPFFNETSMQGAPEFASNRWVIAHSLGIGGFIALTLGFFGLYLQSRQTLVESWALRGFVLCLVGSSLTLPFFGAEAFSLQVIGNAAVQQNNPALIPMVNQVRFGPGIAFIVGGLICVAAATIIMATVVWKSRVLPKWSGIPLAAGFAVYIPQLQGDPVLQLIRIGVGIVILIGSSWLAWGIVHRRSNIPVE